MDNERPDGSHDDAPKDTMSDRRLVLGRRLREARIKSGMTEESLAQATKISRNFIVALEEGRFEALPAAVFGRGFVRSIAKTTGADPAELVRLYGDAWPGPDSAAQQLNVRGSTTGVTQRTPARGRSGRISKVIAPLRPMGRLIVAAPVVAILIVGVIYVAIRARIHSASSVDETTVSLTTPSMLDNQTKTTPIQASSESVAESASSEAAAVAAGEPVPVEAVAKAPSDPAPPTLDAVDVPDTSVGLPPEEKVTLEAAVQKLEMTGEQNTGEQVLELVVSAPVKVRIALDRDKAQTNELKPDAYRFTFKEKAELLIFDAAAVEVAFNGRSLGPLGAKGRVRRLSFMSPQPAQNAANKTEPLAPGANGKKM